MAALKTTALALAALSLCACASHKNTRVGDSISPDPLAAESKTADASDDDIEADAPKHDELGEADVPEHGTQKSKAQGASDGDSKVSADGKVTDDANGAQRAHPEPRELALARAALHRSAVPKNHLDLAMAVSERSSDLPWVMTIENRSAKPIILAALPSLIRLELHPPAAPVQAKETTPTPATQKQKEPEVVVCQSETPPSKLSEEETITLNPGEIIFHGLDPRTLCEKEDALREGWKAELSYGFPIQTRKLWRGGKLIEEEMEQKAPFVAERSPAPGDELLPLKRLTAESFVLGATYPLSELTAKLKKSASHNEADSSAASAIDAQAGSNESAAKPPPPPPLRLKVANLGKSKDPEERLVEVRVRNNSPKSIKIFLRRELITYEVTGPTGTKTCTMQPADRAPDPSQFETIAPGSSSYFPTRLAEACPPGTWDAPGNYSVSARMVSTASGEEHGMNAFTGIATTETPARLTVIGDQKSKRPFLRIAPSQAAAQKKTTPHGSSSPETASPLGDEQDADDETDSSSTPPVSEELPSEELPSEEEAEE